MCARIEYRLNHVLVLRLSSLDNVNRDIWRAMHCSVLPPCDQLMPTKKKNAYEASMTHRGRVSTCSQIGHASISNGLDSGDKFDLFVELFLYFFFHLDMF